jgi:hypothetical protein
MLHPLQDLKGVLEISASRECRLGRVYGIKRLAWLPVCQGDGNRCSSRVRMPKTIWHRQCPTSKSSLSGTEAFRSPAAASATVVFRRGTQKTELLGIRERTRRASP